ncbi:MAG: DNA mismatch repair protein MutS [Myxococcales bacterium]|nr:DNA mismatch repair protein MutS [Myxococcales bacterium]
MMRQFLAIKAKHPGSIVFYRMGDFYEMFLADAELAAPLLGITLTSRDKGKSDPVPMCGIPVHAATGYVKRLAELGHRVAICEQVEDAKLAAGKRLVQREVVEVVTPGLVGDPEGLDARREVSVAALWPGEGGSASGLAMLEASTGRFEATTGAPDPDLSPALLEELGRIGPREVLVPEAAAERLGAVLRKRLGDVAVTPVSPVSFEPSAAPAQPDGFVPDDPSPAFRAAAGVLAYLHAHQPFAVRQTARLRVYALSDTMILDAATCAHLELFESAEDRSRRHTLIERIDRTATAPGARLLARWLSYPLLEPSEIVLRQEAVGSLASRDRVRARLRDALGSVGDLERILAKSARPGSTPRDVAALGRSVGALPGVGEALGGAEEALVDAHSSCELLEAPVPVPAVAELIAEALIDDPPAIPRGSRGAGETGYVREGFRPELDALRDAARKGREWIAGLEARERERLGISTLKVCFHPVHGYAFDVTRPHLARVPDDWERKQTLKGSERFTTAELREVADRVLGAHERAAALEREIFEGLRQEALSHTVSLQNAARDVARLDALASLAEVAREDGWVRPEVDAGRVLEIRRGRHPVVERVLREDAGDEFVPNDADLDPEAAQILLLTGPNMSGKSTYLRQVALIALLAQIGSFVPAESARIGVVDRVFTRVGASDRLARGESTFMVEMRETAQILSQASDRSLVILDEIGRGTSTFDGLSIAWAVAEYLHDTPGLGARTLFATHYHELADLARTRPRVRNAHFEVREWGEDVVFLRRLVPGEANRSYGIQVARLAGLPAPVIARAREVLTALESGEATTVAQVGGDAPVPGQDQLGLFAPAAPAPEPTSAERSVLARLREADLDKTAPIDALLLLQSLRIGLDSES